MRTALLGPALPLLGWGPFTHMHVTRLAWRKAQEHSSTAANDLLDRLAGQEEILVRASVSADAISSYHVLNASSLYDYMHNWIPDNAYGMPRFGYALVSHSLSASSRDLAVACGWLAHQLADWWAHYALVGTDGNPAPWGEAAAGGVFPGYANSFRILGPDFYPEVLERYQTLDHALVEALYDLLVIFTPDAADLRKQRPALFEPGPANPLTLTSELWAARLPRIPPELVREMQRSFHRVMDGLITLYALLGPFRSWLQRRVDDLLQFGAMGQEYLERCADKIWEGLFQVSYEEMAQWGAPEALPPGTGPPFAVREGVFSRRAYPGTLLLTLAASLGELREEVDQTFLAQLAQVLSAQPPTLPGLALRFLSALARGWEEDDLYPLRWLRYSLPPVITLSGVTPSEVPARLPQVLAARELTVVFVPAAPLTSDPLTGPKSLDPSSLRLAFNGYDVDRYPAYFRVEKCREGGKIIWHCRLRQPVEEGSHHVWAAARDRAGTAALPFTHEVRLGGEARLGS